MRLELWSDSFHEGDWMCLNIAKIIEEMGGSKKVEYIHNFIPLYTYKLRHFEFEIIVFGNYDNWANLPETITELLFYGKPDGILYNEKSDEIVFVIEETAATPTGNQALQRSERLYGSSKLGYPFWYLLSEFGMHLDGGTRRDSIWPSIQALKLSIINRTPSIVLHYSSSADPENYNIGEGVSLLFESVTQMIINLVKNSDNIYLDTYSLLVDQYQNMIDFIDSQWRNLVRYLPGEEFLKDPMLASEIVDYILKKTNIIPNAFKNGFLIWPKIIDLPNTEINNLESNGMIKNDPLTSRLEDAVDNKKAFILSSRSGSGRPSSKTSLTNYINDQRSSFDNSTMTNPVEFTMSIDDFPRTDTGRYHVTTSKNIVYLLDSWKELKDIIQDAYPRLIDKLFKYDSYDNIPVMIYVSNSVSRGRIYGDPYTGQIAAYTFSLAHNLNEKRFIVSYYPHQVHNLYLSNRKNKGKTILNDLVNISIYNNGVVVDNKSKEVI